MSSEKFFLTINLQSCIIGATKEKVLSNFSTTCQPIRPTNSKTGIPCQRWQVARRVTVEGLGKDSE